MFKNQAVVGFNKRTKGKKNSFAKQWGTLTSLDFSKLYPNILLLLAARYHVCDKMKNMLYLQKESPLVKSDMVSVIGKLVFYDSRLHHAIKSCAVAIMFDLIDNNPFLGVVARATYSVFVKNYHNNKPLKLSTEYFQLSTIPVKVENSFKSIIFMGTMNRYIGFLTDDELVSKDTLVREQNQ